MTTLSGLLASAHRELALRHVVEAISLFDKAEASGADPDECAAGRWKCHMLLGEYEAAWVESDSIQLRGRFHASHLWDGKPLRDRHVMVRCLHGLGDTLQYLRYVPLVRDLAASVTVQVQPPLKELIASTPGLADRVMTWEEAEPYWDQEIEVVELPRIFRTTLGTVPPAHYLRVPTESCGRSGFDVGLVWAAGDFDPARTIGLDHLRPLLELPIRFYSFQGEPARQELNGLSLVCDGFNNSLVETAARLREMDLLITVDTMMAHLAGSLGLPVWTLLTYASDWRWMMQRDDSPWYPTMRLFRQPIPGDWGAVVSGVREALLQEVPLTFACDV